MLEGDASEIGRSLITELQAKSRVFSSEDVLQCYVLLERALALARKYVEIGVLRLKLTPAQSNEQLIAYAQEYESVRQSMPPGGDRTARMTTIMAQARELTEQVSFMSSDIGDLFESGSEGKSIVALTLLQAIPYPTCFDIVLRAIYGSKSAFEQYVALLRGCPETNVQ